MAVTIYTKTGCPYCAAAKKHYLESGISVIEKNVTADPSFVDEFLALSPDRVVPVIVQDDVVTVGFGGGG